MSALMFMNRIFSFSLFVCCIISHANSQNELPRYEIDLDKPASTRWQIIAHDYARYRPFISKMLRNKIPPEVLPLAETVALYLDTIFDEPYPAEMKGLAEAFNISLPEIILLNMYYDISAFCTSIVAQNEQGDIYHARNLDYSPTELLRNLSIHIDFVRNEKVVYTGITFVGYIGILTGQKPFAFTITLDERDKGYVWENIFMLLLSKAKPVGFFIRSLLASNESDFNNAIKNISEVKMIAPAYIIVGGVNKGEGAVVTRARTEALDVWRLNVSEGRWFLVETNYDHWKPPPSSDDRRDPAIKAMNQIGQQGVGVEGLFKVMSTQPVMNSGTVYTTIMSAKYPSTLKSWRRQCCS